MGNNHKITIALVYDFTEKINMTREGLGIHAKELLYYLLKYNDGYKLDIWSLEINKENVKDLFAEILNDFPDRISFYNEKISTNKDFNYKLKRSKYRALYSINKALYKIFGSGNFKNKYKKYQKKSINPISKKNLKKMLLEAMYKFSNADIIYIFTPTITTGSTLKLPKIMQIHDLFTVAYRDLFITSRPQIDEFNKFMINNIETYVNNGTYIVCTSEYIAKTQCLKYIPRINPNKLSIIPFPPMIKKFNEGDLIEKETFKKKFGLPEKYIAYPTQNRPNKNIITLLKALKFLKQQNIKIKLAVTGKLEDIPSDSEYVNKNGLQDYIIEIGTIEEKDLYNLYKHANMVVATTIIEGIGMSGQIMEALKIGEIPVIHAVSDGLSEAFASRGLTLQSADLNWFDKYDYETLAEKIIDVLDNPQKHIEKQKHIIEKFCALNWKDTANKYNKLIMEILNEAKN